jgi:enoyl-CoA hydratase
MSDVVEFSEDRGIVTLRLNRPEVKNAVDGEMMSALGEHVARLSARDDLIAVILCAAGQESFCSGGDLVWMRGFDTPEKGSEMSRRMQGILQGIATLPAPVIGVVSGYALGGGTEVALACDLRVMEEHAFMQFKQARVGVMSGWGGGARLLRLIGYARAMELFASCRRLLPAEALKLGLANEVVATGEGLDEALRIANSFRKASGRSIRVIKRYLQDAVMLDQDAAASLEADRFAEVWCSPEHGEAMAAFRDKRRPDFGRG